MQQQQHSPPKNYHRFLGRLRIQRPSAEYHILHVVFILAARCRCQTHSGSTLPTASGGRGKRLQKTKLFIIWTWLHILCQHFIAVTESLHLLSAVCSRHFLFLNFGERFCTFYVANKSARDKGNVDVDYFKTSDSRFHNVLQRSCFAINFITEYLIHYYIKKYVF